MLKGHVFSKQLFGNPIFALFINTFTGGKNGVSDNYKNGMAITYSGSNLTVDSGAVCIQGRLLEEDTSTTIVADTDAFFCKLVIEINLDKQNTESEFVQGTYKIVKNSSTYPALTQTNIVKNNSGIYQYELARFKTSTSGISDFQDMRTFLNFDSIYSAIETEYRSVLNELKDELQKAKDNSIYALKEDVVGTVLYENEEGTSESFTLSDDVKNYKKLDFIVSRNDAINHGNEIITIYTNNKDGVVAYPKLINYDGQALIIHTCRATIEGYNVNISINERRLVFYISNGLMVDTESRIAFKKVVGYKN